MWRMNGCEARTLAAGAIAALAGAVTLAGCDDPVTTPDADVPAASRGAQHASAAIIAQWDEIARSLVIKLKPTPNAAFRQFAYLSLAQYAAVVAAEESRHGPRPSPDVAVAAASATVLSYFFPSEAQALADMVSGPELPGQGSSYPHVAAAEALGRHVGGELIARAQTDGFDATWTGTVPVGPGLWSSSANPPAPPLLPLQGQMRTFFLTSGSQFRPPPPPAFGSAEYLAALAEVRHISDTRTTEQTHIAQFWAMPAGTSLPAGFWNQTALDLIAQSHLSARSAAHILALMHAAMQDAITASHDAKYTYWLIRPSRADPAIKLAIGLPNHPSYPSNHAAASTAAAAILGSFFPAELERLDAMAQEAGLSRLYGGIHYRFDLEAGRALALAVAHVALEFDRHHDLLSLTH